jgi:ESCRT-II complex subunit VPS25
VLSSREKQLALWRELILTYHTAHKIKTLVLHDCPLWENRNINRRLSPDEIQSVVEDFCQHGHGEWLDDESSSSSNNNSGNKNRRKTACRILWRKPEQLATDIYEWAQHNGHVNAVCTIYELHSGEDVHGMSFQGADEELLRRALHILQERGKCTIFKGESSSEDGIKFF